MTTTPDGYQCAVSTFVWSTTIDDMKNFFTMFPGYRYNQKRKKNKGKKLPQNQIIEYFPRCIQQSLENSFSFSHKIVLQMRYKQLEKEIIIVQSVWNNKTDNNCQQS